MDGQHMAVKSIYAYENIPRRFGTREEGPEKIFPTVPMQKRKQQLLMTIRMHKKREKYS